jgi:hypothetical protein
MVVTGINVYVGRALVIVAHGDQPRTAAYLTVLDVLLMHSRAGVEGDLTRLSAIRAVDVAHHVGDAVSKGELVIELVLVGVVAPLGVIRQLPFVVITHLCVAKA